MSKLIYLALPYSFDPNLSFAIANEVSAMLMERGNVVFSPVSHSHHIAEYLPNSLKNSHSFWMKMDLPILDKCDELMVVLIGENGQELVDKSEGCQAEIKRAISNDIPVNFFEYDLNYN